MARLHGKGGLVTFAAYSLHVHEWTLDRSAELSDGTEFGMVNRTRDVGLKDAKGTFKAFVSDTTSLPDAGAVAASLVLKVGGTKTYTMPAVLISTIGINVNVSGNAVATFSFELAGDGTASAFVIA